MTLDLNRNLNPDRDFDLVRDIPSESPRAHGRTIDDHDQSVSAADT
ncbi:MAG: hypothetical protein KF724_08745 [Phycisphaeraceae bacterium]|nr:hypothetical protein [Phycisphaeraceae bacterium]